MNEFNWQCPYCNNAQTVSDSKVHYEHHNLDAGETFYGSSLAYRVIAIGCSNPDCKKIEISFAVGPVKSRGSYGEPLDLDDEIVNRRITPESKAKPLPDYIPFPIQQDYLEACRIVDLSPKAAATLARRCLQGMIRDFCKISKSRLIDEISEIKKQFDEGNAIRGVSDESFEAIDAIRKIGNIGAHMEKDINVIVDVDPYEATTLISLLESLFDEWYVARHKREERFAKINQIAKDKETQKKPPVSTS